MVLLTLGTGVGGGLILNGQLYRGVYGAAAELGHMTIDFDGPPCQGTCPGIGHLEVLASGTAAGVLARRSRPSAPTAIWAAPPPRAGRSTRSSPSSWLITGTETPARR